MKETVFEDDVGKALARAEQLLDIRRPTEALRILAAVLADDPDNAVALCAAAQAELQLNRAGSADELAARAMAAAPEWEFALRLRAEALRAMGRRAEAAAAARAAVALSPNTWQSHYTLAAICSGAPEDSAEAYTAARRAIVLAPNEADAWAVLGYVAVENGDQTTAQKALEKALQLAPAHAGARNDLGRLQLLRRDPIGAAGHFVAAVASDVRCREAAQNLNLALSAAFSDVLVGLGVLLALIGWVIAATGAYPSVMVRLAVCVLLLRVAGRLLADVMVPLLRRPVGRYVRALLRLYPALATAVVLQIIGVVSLMAVWPVPEEAWPWLLTVGTTALFGSALLGAVHARRSTLS